MTRRLIEEGGAFSVSILSREDRAVVRRFVKPVVEVKRDAAGLVVAMQGQPVFEVAGGLPCLAGALGWLACEVHQVGDWSYPSTSSGIRPAASASHVLFVGEVIDAGERTTMPASEGGPAPEDPGCPADGGHPDELRGLSAGASAGRHWPEPGLSRRPPAAWAAGRSEG